MKVQIKVSPKVFIEATGDTHTAIFENAAELQEVFGTYDKCRKCNGTDLRFVVREDSKQNKYYELHCQNFKCRARLAFGQSKVGHKLYPKRKENEKQSMMDGQLKEGDYLPDGGWLKWDKEKGKSE